ncbi:hypothetical protein F5880DRAFT_602651 [Lentinula raphanica]|nr:hypothetical protein F5880DRAFT_602651 [Lentinula raphanica]
MPLRTEQTLLHRAANVPGGVNATRTLEMERQLTIGTQRNWSQGTTKPSNAPALQPELLTRTSRVGGNWGRRPSTILVLASRSVVLVSRRVRSKQIQLRWERVRIPLMRRGPVCRRGNTLTKTSPLSCSHALLAVERPVGLESPSRSPSQIAQGRRTTSSDPRSWVQVCQTRGHLAQNVSRATRRYILAKTMSHRKGETKNARCMR